LARRRPTPHAHRFPYTTLFRSEQRRAACAFRWTRCRHTELPPACSFAWVLLLSCGLKSREGGLGKLEGVLLDALFQLSEVVCQRDRKSTRLNSSHVASSYAVFC